MTLFEEIKNGLESGIDAINNGTPLKTTVVSTKDDDDTEETPKEN